MANQRTDTQSVINLVINGRQAMTSMRELTDAQRRLNAEVRNMRPIDPQYPARERELQALNRAVAEHRERIQGVVEETQNWKEVAKGVFTADLFTSVAGWAGNAIGLIKNAFQETEKFRAILTTAFNGNADFADKSLKMLSDFAAKTPFQLNEATAGFIKLVNRGFVPTQNEMIKMGDLASSQGKSFDQYVEALLDAQTGEFERLKEFGVKASKNGDMVSLSFKGMTQEVANTDSAIRNAMLAFGDMQGVKGSMASVSETVEGLASNIDDTWSQIFSGVGKSSSGMINGFYRTYGGLLNWFKEKLIDVNLSESMEKERFELVKLEMQLQSANTTQDERVTIIKKLQEQYPSYFANINTEKINTLELANAFKKLNTEYLNKIVLQKQNESLTKAEDQRADTKLGQFKAEANIRDYISRIKDKSPNLDLFGNTDVDKARTLLSQLQAHGDKAFKGISHFAKNDLKNLLSDYDFLDNKFLEQTSATTKIMNERQKLAKSLGINPDEDLTIKKVDNPIKDQITKPKVDNKQADKDKEKALSEFKKLDEDYKKLGIKALDDQLSKNQKEIEQEGRKYDELIAKQENFLKLKGTTPAQKKATEETIKNINTDKDTAVNNLRIRQEEETNLKINDLRTKLTDAHETEYQKQADTINKFYDQQERESAGNDTAIANLKLERLKELSKAELREKERLEDEKLKIESKSGFHHVSEKERKLALIKKQYDDEITALREKFSKELQETQAFKDAVSAIEQNRKNDITAVDTNAEKTKKDAILQSTQAIADSYFTIAANNRAKETEMNLSAINKQREQELSNKNLTEKQKKAINDKYDKKVKEEKLKAWRADQKASASQAVISGALAVTKLLATPWAAVAAGIAAAANVVTILAQEPPEFGVGVRNFQGGLAVVGESGQEVVEENGKTWLTNGPTLANLSPGANVYTATETTNMKKQSLGEQLYPLSSYSIDLPEARKAEMSYRSPFTAPTFNTAASTDSPGKQESHRGNFNTVQLEKKMDEMINAIGKGISFNYSSFEDYKVKIEATRENQQA